jgi:hypothetical protein
LFVLLILSRIIDRRRRRRFAPSLTRSATRTIGIQAIKADCDHCEAFGFRSSSREIARNVLTWRLLREAKTEVALMSAAVRIIIAIVLTFSFAAAVPHSAFAVTKRHHHSTTPPKKPAEQYLRSAAPSDPEHAQH